MRFPGKRLLTGLKNWRLGKSSASSEDEPPVESTATDDPRQPESERLTGTISLRITTKDSTAEDTGTIPDKEPAGSARKAHLTGEPIKHDEPVNLIHEPAENVPEKQPPSPRKPRPSRASSRNIRPKPEDEVVTDRELEALEAENARLRRLLKERMREKENKPDT